MRGELVRRHARLFHNGHQRAARKLPRVDGNRYAFRRIGGVLERGMASSLMVDVEAGSLEDPQHLLGRETG